MNDLSQAMADTSAPPANWFEFAKRHRAVLASVFVLVFPLIMPFKALAANILIYGLYALGFNLLFGFLGLLSFGHAALFGTGAYLCGIAIVHFQLPWYAAIVVGTISGALMAAAIGALAIRTRGNGQRSTRRIGRCAERCKSLRHRATGGTRNRETGRAERGADRHPHRNPLVERLFEELAGARSSAPRPPYSLWLSAW